MAKHEKLHPLLERHLKESGFSDFSVPPSPEVWQQFLNGLNEACTEAEIMLQIQAFEVKQKQILELIATGSSLPNILSSLVRAVESQVPDMIGSILLLDPDGLHVRHGAAPGLPQAYNQAMDGLPIGPNAGSCGTAAYYNKPVIVEDISTDPRWKDYRDIALVHNLRACWAQPIQAGDGRVIGTCAMYYNERRLPTIAEIKLIEEAARLAGIAIERSRNEEALRKSEAAEREQRLLAETLRDTASVLITALDLNDTMKHILDNVEKVVPHAAASIALLEGDRLRVAALVGYPEESVQTLLHFVFPASMPTVLEMLKTKTAFLISDTRQSADWTFYPEALWVRSYLGAPIIVRDTVVGFLNLDSDTAGFFRPEHVERLQTFANQASLAFERAKLYDQLQLHAAELERRVAERTLDLEQALASEKELSKLRADFIWTVSHEFRTPLAVILSTFEILKQYGDRLTDEQIEGQFKKTDTAIQRLTELMDEALRVNQSEAGQLPGTPASS